MISPKRIERLWAACPELRPFGLRMHTAGWFTEHADQKRHKGTGPDYVYQPEESAHALIRDRIVWWLAANKSAPKILFPDGTSGYGSYDAFEDAIAVSVRDGESSVGVFYDAGTCPSDHQAYYSPVCEDPDPTLACVLAAERVLNLPEWTEPPTPDVGDFRT